MASASLRDGSCLTFADASPVTAVGNLDHNLASDVTILHVLHCRWCLAQRLGPVDNRSDLAGLNELGERSKVRGVL